MDERPRSHNARYVALVVLGLVVASLLFPLLDGLSVAGFFGDKTYLIILQDNDEIRSTGGLMDVLGLLTMHNGHIVNAEFHYLSGNAANSSPWNGVVGLDGPESFTRFFGVDNAQLSDSNVQYDFATFAPKMQSDFYNVTGNKVDGIIALDFTAVQAIMRITGPATVSGEVITDRNVVDRLHYYSATAGGAKESLTSQISTLMFDLARQVRDSSISQKVALVNTLRSLENEKHVLLYPGQGFLFRNAGGERTTTKAADFISVVDTTLGTAKADFGVNRTIDYRVQLLSDGSAIANLTLTYTNDCWWNYDVFSTILVPANAEPVTAHNATQDFKGPQVTSAEGFTAFSSRILVAANASGSVTYVYKIPHIVNESGMAQHYDLYVQKQAGINRYTLSTDVTLPLGAKLVTAQNIGADQELNQDAHVSVVYT